jgi:ribonuclease R
MQDRIGESYVGSITAVTSFGIFVTLDDLFVEGLVHISELGKDYFHHDEARHELLGERTGQRYRLSDRVGVQLVRVDLESRKIDFTLVEGVERPTARSGKTERDRARSSPVEDVQAIEKPVREHARPKRLLATPVADEGTRGGRSPATAKARPPIVAEDDDEVVSWRKLAGLPDRKGPQAIAVDALPARGRRPHQSGDGAKAGAQTPAKSSAGNAGKNKPTVNKSAPPPKPASKPKAKPKAKPAAPRKAAGPKPAARKPAAPKGGRHG